MKRYKLLSMLLGFSMISQAQQTIQLSGHLPKVQTAEALAVQRYTTYPMDYSTGLPNITIPLYEIKSGDIILPITLTYHSSGFKPNEATGRIATGWTLNAEPSISKQIRGLDDAIYPSVMNDLCGFYYLDAGKLKLQYGENLYKKKIADGKIDVLPDIYYYRLADKGGAFTTASYNGSSQQFIPQPYGDINITGSPGSIAIEDDNGISYKFGGGSSYINSYQQTGLPVELLCREITSKMTRARIDFTYNESGLVNHDYRSYVSKDVVIIEESNALRYPRLTRIINGNQRMYDIQDTGNLQELFYTEYNYAPYVYTANTTETITTQPLRKIAFDGGSILFEGDNHTGIDILVRDLSGNIIKEINLYCSSYDLYEDTDMQHRKLDSVKISVPGGDIQRYTFEYFDTYNAPDRDTRSVDYWGFYNGVYDSENTSMIPSFSTTLDINSRPVTFQHTGMERKPNVYSTMTGILNKIIDPNGAETSFEYEGNKTGINAAHYYADTTAQMPPGFWVETKGPFVPQLNYDMPIGGLRIKRITEKDPVTGEKLYREFSYGCLTQYWGENYNFPTWGVTKKLAGPNTFRTRQGHLSEKYQQSSTSSINTWYCNPIADITFNGGTPILYGRVTERKWGGSGGNIWTEYYYTAPRLDTHRLATIGDECDGWDYQCIFNGKLVIDDSRDIDTPFTYKTFLDERYGKLYKKIEYAQTEAGKMPIRKEEYTNTFVERYLSFYMWSD
ncbi:hypothetical protein [Pararcticibacter amylolyticus]|uniref:Uncharacterized protein n=1 Tax=Pararcticibacter amylolyticus TaxID=2173175 RepID=A0A2U2PL29_9SPHI|nr:hypothetical protein [Pararcticibacter amylolyticus]PWG82116.1 hypothetical protein DDR33_03620 [Pararcticibacter amylolyticus]